MGGFESSGSGVSSAVAGDGMAKTGRRLSVFYVAVVGFSVFLMSERI